MGVIVNWKSPYWNNEERDIPIPVGVTDIDHENFCGCVKLTNITIPEGVVAIGDYAFNGCKSLTKIILPKSLIRLGKNVFKNCENLRKIYWGDNPVDIDEIAF